MSKNNELKVCFHCSLPAKGAAACLGDVQGVQHHFCCSGCLNVCQIIHEVGLDNFYQRLKHRESTIAPPPDAPTDIEQYDLPEVQAEFVQNLADDSCKTQLMVEGIHCAACVWLIEKALVGMDGIIQAEVNLAHHRLALHWQPKNLALSDVIRRLAGLGYAAVPFDADSAEGAIREHNRKLLFRLGFAGFGAMNIMWISIALYAGAFSGISNEYSHFFHWVSFAIATPVLFYSGSSILRSAWQGLCQGLLGMDLPIAIGALITYTYSVWQTWIAGSHVYFDTVVTFLFVILIGRYLEALARRNASSATLRLLELQPRMATRITEHGEERVSVRKLHVGDHLRIRPGDKIPADGSVIEGQSHVNESMLTGESKAIHKSIHCSLIAGTVNGESPLSMQVEKLGSETVLSRIIHLVESAQGSKAHIQDLADRIAPYFVGVTLSLASLTFLYWFSIDVNTALLAATAVLIITCPCALGLATPMAIAVSTGLAAKHGVLIRNGKALEKLAGISHVIMDKTGTLTEGNIAVTNILFADNPNHALQLAGSIERHDSHPIAKAISASQETKKLGFFDAHSLKVVAGLGVQGIVQAPHGDCEVWVGNKRLMQRHGIILTKEHHDACRRIEQGMGIAIFVAADGKLLGLLQLEDKLRAGTHTLISYLAQSNIAMTILTGDSIAAANYLKKELSQNMTLNIRVIAEVLPENKATEVSLLQQQGEHVLMIGDGVNDAPALAQADISIAMGTGTDVSMECSDIVLMGSELQNIPWALALGKRTLKSIRQNLTFSLIYNIVLVPTAMLAWITPIFAALAMPLSSLVVIGNAILIRQHMRK